MFYITGYIEEITKEIQGSSFTRKTLPKTWVWTTENKRFSFNFTLFNWKIENDFMHMINFLRKQLTEGENISAKSTYALKYFYCLKTMSIS